MLRSGKAIEPETHYKFRNAQDDNSHPKFTTSRRMDKTTFSYTTGYTTKAIPQQHFFINTKRHFNNKVIQNETFNTYKSTN